MQTKRLTSAIAGLLILALVTLAMATFPHIAGATPVPSNPFNSSTYDGSIHEDPAYDYLVAACDGDTDNAMTFNTSTVPVTDFPVLLKDNGGSDPNGCNEGSVSTGLMVAGTAGTATATGVKGDWSLTAPSGTTITGLRYSDPLFVLPSSTTLISGWYGELAGDSDGKGLAAEHDPTQTYAQYQNGVTPTYDCVSATPNSCQVSNNSTNTFVFNTDPWTTASTSQPALQAIALGFECRESSCYYPQTTYAGVGSALFQLDDPDGAPAAGAGSGGSARFNDQGVAAASGWLKASQITGTTFTTDSDAGGICTLTVGLYNASGKPVDVDSDAQLQSPAIDPQTGYFDSSDPCSDTGSAASVDYKPDFATLSALPSGTYYLNAEAQNPSEYQQGTYSWYAGGLTDSSSAPAADGIPVQIDNTVPTVTISGEQTGWSSTPQTITVTGTTGPSGVTSLKCTDGGSAISPVTTQNGNDSETQTYTVAANGSHAITCTATSGVGTSASSQAVVEIDGGSPQVSFSDTQSPTAAGWFDTGQTVHVSATEPDGLSGIASLDCESDSGEELRSIEGSLSLSITGDGSHTISCQATTNAGVTDPAQTYAVDIDTQTPQVSITGPGSGTYSAGSAQLQVTAEDPGPSGIAQVDCRQNGGAYAPLTLSNGSGKFDVTGASGTYTVDCYAVTNAGIDDSADPASYQLMLDDGDSGSSSLTDYGSSPLIDDGKDPYSDGPSQTSWYRGAQQVTVTASKSSGAPITEITCTGAGVQQNYPNTGATGAETATVSVQPPGGMLACTATDSAGNVYPLGSYEFLIDDTPPSGSFVGQDPNDLALVRVNASDQGSGVHKVEISFTCQSGPCLTSHNGGPYPIQSEAAVYNSADGYWEAYIPDTGTWPNGDYSLTATMTDLAGNTGTTTSFTDGTTAGISLPARVLTTLDASITAGGQTAASQVQASTPGAQQALPATRHTERHSLVLGYGMRATLRGRLLDRAGDTPMAHARIVIYMRLTTGGALKRIGTAKTNAHGRFTYRLAAGPSRRVIVTYDGNDIMHPAAARVLERFRGRVRIRVARKIKAGHALVLSGRVFGGHIPKGGVLVQPRYQVKGLGGKWAPFGNAIRTTRSGRFHVKVHLAKVAGGLTYRLDVRVQAQSGYPFLTAVSQTVTRRVRR